jgi:hypothetical protein
MCCAQAAWKLRKPGKTGTIFSTKPLSENNVRALRSYSACNDLAGRYDRGSISRGAPASALRYNAIPDCPSRSAPDIHAFARDEERYRMSNLPSYEMLARAFATERVDTVFNLMGGGNMRWATAMSKIVFAAKRPINGK